MTSPIPIETESNLIKIRNCVFGFRCGQNWEMMQETSRDGVRFCKECAKDVYWVSNKDMLLEAISLNRCIAMTSPKEAEPNPDLHPELLLGMIRSYEDQNGEPEKNSAFRERLRTRKVF